MTYSIKHRDMKQHSLDQAPEVLTVYCDVLSGGDIGQRLNLQRCPRNLVSLSEHLSEDKHYSDLYLCQHPRLELINIVLPVCSSVSTAILKTARRIYINLENGNFTKITGSLSFSLGNTIAIILRVYVKNRTCFFVYPVSNLFIFKSSRTQSVLSFVERASRHNSI